MRSLAAAWYLVRSRAKPDRLVLLAAAITILLATTLLSSGPIYGDAVALSGVRRTLLDAPATERGIQVTGAITGAAYGDLDELVSEDIGRALTTTGATIHRSARSESFALPDQPPEAATDLTVFDFVQDLDEHVTLVAGEWPGDASADGAVDAVVSEPAAAAMDVAPGDVLDLSSRRDPARTVQVRISGLVTIDDPERSVWWRDPLVLDGVTVGSTFTTFGPLMVTPDTFLRRLATNADGAWRVEPHIEQLTIDEMTALRRGVDALDDRLNRGRLANDRLAIDTELSAMLRTAERSLLVTRSGLLVSTAQLAILATYALLFTAGLLLEQRRVETALLRFRGADTWQIALVALTEAVLLALPATAAGPWVAALALRALNRVGPLAEVGLELEPRVTSASFVLAALAALGCVVALVVPALWAGRTYEQTRAARGRQQTQGVLQRARLDLVLLVLAALGYWQLRRYGGPLTTTVRGRLGLDPLLVVAPAMGLLAGAVVVLRVVPLLARLAERITGRGTGLTGALGAWQLARRPLRYARSALLLMLALAIGLFTTVYARTWSRSQQDQADYAVGADIVVEPDRRGGAALPDLVLADAQRQLPGVGSAVPVFAGTVGAAGVEGSGDLLAVDAGSVAQVALLRPDLAADDLARLVAPLAEGRAAPPHIALRGQPRQLAVTAGVVFDPPPDGSGASREDPVPTLTVVVRDAAGLLHRVGAGTIAAGAPQRLEVDLTRTLPDGTTAQPSYPLDLVALEVRVPSPESVPRTGEVVVTAVEAGARTGWEQIELGTGWAARPGRLANPVALPEVEADVAPGGGVLLRLVTGASFDRFDVPVTFVATPDELTDPGVIPIIVNDAFLASAGAAVGATVPATLAAERRDVRIVAAVRGFPTLDPTRPGVVADLGTLTAALYASDGDTITLTSTWLDVDPARAADVHAALRVAPFSSAEVDDRLERAASLRADPVALGIIGALSLGFVAAALFAAIGFAVSAAVSARERLNEFALLRAMGLSQRQLAGWLSVENGAMVALSIAGGTGLGLLLAWLVLPYVSLTQNASRAVPDVVVVVPWLTIVALDLVIVAALVLVVVVTGRLLRRVAVASVLRLGEER